MIILVVAWTTEQLIKVMRSLNDGNTNISRPISKRMAIAVIGFLFTRETYKGDPGQRRKVSRFEAISI